MDQSTTHSAPKTGHPCDLRFDSEYHPGQIGSTDHLTFSAWSRTEENPSMLLRDSSSESSILLQTSKLSKHEERHYNLTSIYACLRSTWARCLIAWSLSLILTALIVILLSLFNNKPHEAWHFPITLNAMVSAIVTLLYIVIMLPITTCLAQLKWNHFHATRRFYDIEVFDRATQSLWGGLNFLLARPTSSLGITATALMFIVTAIGPFFQQIIRDKTSSLIVGTAYLPITTVWGAGQVSLNRPVDLSQYTHAEIFEALTANPNATFDVTPTTYAIGNSSWSSYQTLAIRSECRDATNLLNSSSKCNISETSPHHFQCFPELLPEDSWVNWTLPNDISFVLNNIGSSNLQVAPVSVSLLFKDKGLILSDFFVMTQSFNESNPNDHKSMWNGTTFVAECILQIVTETLRSSYMDGILHEEKLQDPTQHNSDDAMASSPVLFNEDWYTQNRSLIPPCLDLANKPSPYPLLFCPVSSTYGGDPFISDLPDILNSTAIEFVSDLAALNDVMNNAANALTRRARSFPISKEGWCAFRSNVGGDYDHGTCNGNYTYLKSIFGDSIPSSTVTGPTFIDKITYDIQWGWIALPASLLACVLVLIVATAIDTKRKGMLVFGNSSLATMVYGVDAESRSRLLGCQTIEEIEKVARHSLVRFDHSRKMLVETTAEYGDRKGPKS